MGKTVLVYDPIAQEGMDILSESGCTIIKRDALKPEHYKDVQGIIVRTSPINSDIIESFPSLKVVARHGVGVDNIDVKYATEKGILITNTPRANIISVAEHTIGMLLYLVKNFPLSNLLVRKDRFKERDQNLITELGGKRLGVLGYGKIGSHVTAMAICGFNMEVLVYDPFKSAEGEGITQVDSLDVLLKQVDYLTLHLPLNETTVNYIAREELYMLPRGAIILNAARGEVLNLDDLYESMKAGHIIAAGIDVYSGEFPDLNHPIYRLDNILFTPHNAALTKEAMVRMATGAAENIAKILNGGLPVSAVNASEINKLF